MSLYYILLISIPVLCAILNKKTSSKTDFFNKIGFIFLIVMVAFRKNIGVDFKNYQLNYYNLSSNFDIGYTLLCSVLRSFSLPFSALLGVVGFFNCLVIYKFIDKNVDRDNRWIALFIYLGLFDIFIYSLSAIRQSISISFYLLSLICFENKKNFNGYIMIILGLLFHWSIVLMIPISFLIRKFKNVKTFKLLLLVIVIPLIYNYIMTSNFISKIPFLNYNMNFYLNIEKYNVIIPKINIIIFTITSFVWILFITYFKGLNDNSKIKISKGSILSKTTAMTVVDWSVLLFLISKICLALVYNGALPRLTMFLYFLLPISIAQKFSYFGTKYRILMICLLFIVIWYSLYNNVISNPYYTDPGFGLI